MNNVKVFTPKNIIATMLEYGGYGYQSYSNFILYKHVMDNSCGDGAILKEIVFEYVVAFYKSRHSCPQSGRVPMDDFTESEKKEVSEMISTYIHGIEIDPVLHKQCIENLDKFVAYEFGLYNIKWDIICADALTCHKYDGKMDYVFANPPYQRVHDFGNKKDFYKSFNFIDKGMADLYIVFFELGLRMLNERGLMTYITPSSWTTSMAGSKFRQHIINNNLLQMVIDYKGERIFKNATTFSMITILNKSRKRYEGYRSVEVLDIKENESMTLDVEDWVIDGKFYFTLDRKAFDTLWKIKTKRTKKYVKVKNGFATLNDKLFIVDNADANKYVLTPITDDDIKWCIKASKNELKMIVYPYHQNGEPKKFDELSDSTKKYLLSQAKELGVDTSKDNWWLYGRSQAIMDMPFDRIFVNNLVKNDGDLKYGMLKPFYGVYSGYYIICKDTVIQALRQCLFQEHTNELINYIKALGKYKNGGYYTFSSKDLEDYLNYKIEEYYETEDSSED